ncbi:thioredoxin domain-containing protein [Dyadobacter sp. CY345]|uniref:thioredoxin domain-containing protein n=1 Tax=Dyadobacter sp. CY345 TaxID=2909335 RepID=UPI001F23B0C3|nr:thioredoxin domain-containing protein [Dyadobacter sp. CY345]MCF2443366.1 thioredoxin domain-containing protein [Dyadobacter sp. CY345]
MMFIKIPCIAVIYLMLSVLSVKAQTQLNADEFESKLSGSRQVQLLDVRTAAEYQDGHLRHSKNLDYKSPNFKEEIRGLDKSKPVLVYCLSGGRSALASKTLVENGFTQVYELKGGYLKWSSSGKKIEGAESKTAKGMSMADFNKLTASSDVVLIDFYAKWCAPCIKMLPTITKIKSDYQGQAKVETIDYDANKALAKELGIDEIPAFLLYKDGKLVTRKNGMMEEMDFRNLIEDSL